MSVPSAGWRNRDLAEDHSTLEVINNLGRCRVEAADGIGLRRSGSEWYRYEADDFASPMGETQWEWELRRDYWQVRTLTHARLDAYEGKNRVYSKDWNLSRKRDLV